MLIYDEDALLRGLRDISAQARSAFAAACAERLQPAYEAFSRRTGRGDPIALRALLDFVWRSCANESPNLVKVRSEVARGMSLVPSEGEDPWVEEQAYADDAASAVMYALRALMSPATQDATWAARRAYEAVDYYVTYHLGIDDENDALAHPIVQAELRRQRRDLDVLLRCQDREPAPGLISMLRQRAANEAPEMFGIRSV